MCVEVSATPGEVLLRLLKERHLWETELQQEKVLETLDKQTDVYQYSYRNIAPQPSCDFVVLRSGLLHLISIFYLVEVAVQVKVDSLSL